ncbi:hypothetical protein GCM10011519_19540 [Marmoricola endophyticus]|uniref:YibE/F family protein n=1 Tax=Marmoricola endophyticus TaxID=2040280 RepID=A0A917BK08_9ACTN|nr:hypothetical protein GCM10011519_19540 [Marmoricola endophyticus]
MRARPWPAALLLGFLAVVGVAAVVAMVVMWPGRPDIDAKYIADGARLVNAEVTSVKDSCAGQQTQDGAPECAELRVRLLEGSEKGTPATVQVPPQVAESGLAKGDEVQVLQTPGTPPSYSFQSVNRNVPLGVLAAIFVIVVALVARLRGLLAIVGLAFGAFVLVRFMIPALLEGSSGLLVALVGSTAIMFVVLYLAHGPSLRTSAALAGTLVGVALTGGIGLVMIREARLSGVADEGAAFLTTFVPDLDFRGLLLCAVIVAGLGVLNDVTITQASAVWELRGVAPHLTRRELFSRGMRIGRDHIASTIYTIVFAYAGATLAVLLLVYIYRQPADDLLSLEQFAEEVARTLASAIGLVLAVPITTAIAVLTVGEPVDEVPAVRGKHV